jgi:hypothetical protein
MEQVGYAAIQVHVELCVSSQNHPQDLISGNIMLKHNQSSTSHLQDEVFIVQFN